MYQSHLHKSQNLKATNKNVFLALLPRAVSWYIERMGFETYFWVLRGSSERKIFEQRENCSLFYRRFVDMIGWLANIPCILHFCLFYNPINRPLNYIQSEANVGVNIGAEYFSQKDYLKGFLIWRDVTPQVGWLVDKVE